MTLAVNDLVMIVRTLCPGHSDSLLGKIGSVMAEPCFFEMLHPLPETYYRVRVEAETYCLPRSALRKIGGDERELVKWDWRTLGTPSRSIVEA